MQLLSWAGGGLQSINEQLFPAVDVWKRLVFVATVIAISVANYNRNYIDAVWIPERKNGHDFRYFFTHDVTYFLGLAISLLLVEKHPVLAVMAPIFLAFISGAVARSGRPSLVITSHLWFILIIIFKKWQFVGGQGAAVIVAALSLITSSAGRFTALGYMLALIITNLISAILPIAGIGHSTYPNLPIATIFAFYLPFLNGLFCWLSLGVCRKTARWFLSKETAVHMIGCLLFSMLVALAFSAALTVFLAIGFSAYDQMASWAGMSQIKTEILIGENYRSPFGADGFWLTCMVGMTTLPTLWLASSALFGGTAALTPQPVKKFMLKVLSKQNTVPHILDTAAFLLVSVAMTRLLVIVGMLIGMAKLSWSIAPAFHALMIDAGLWITDLIKVV